MRNCNALLGLLATFYFKSSRPIDHCSLVLCPGNSWLFQVGDWKLKSVIFLMVFASLVLWSGSALAFHDGGVAECAGCHTMHNSQDGALVDPNAPLGNKYLLKAGSATDQCLTCHAGYGQFAGGTGYGAGGDFYWVTRTFSWEAHGLSLIHI